MTVPEQVDLEKEVKSTNTTLEHKLSFNESLSLDNIFVPFENGVLPFENIFIPFKDAFYEYLSMSEEEFSNEVEILVASVNVTAVENFLNLEIEELFQVLLNKGGSELTSLMQVSAIGEVESVGRDLDMEAIDISRKFNIIDSVERDLSYFSHPDNSTVDDPMPPTYNTPAVISGDSLAEVTEDFYIVDNGTLTVYDPDVGENGFRSASGTSDSGLGRFEISSEGKWQYELNNELINVQNLAKGQIKYDSFTIYSIDGVPQVITVIITGTNDAPIIGVADLSGVVVEDNANANDILTDNGVIIFTDLDLIDTHTISVEYVDSTNPGGQLGTFDAHMSAIATGGKIGEISWDFGISNADVQFLAANQTIVERYEITLADGNGGTVTRMVEVTITGTNDIPVIEVEDLRGEVIEDAAPETLSDSGVITFTDVDLIDTHTISIEYVDSTNPGGKLGHLDAHVSGMATGGAIGEINWNFSVPNADVQFLTAGETIIESYEITLSDGNGGTVTRVIEVTIIGTNDAPVAQADFASGNEGNEVIASAPIIGNVLTNDTDVDNSASMFSVTTVGVFVGLYGTLTLNGDGSFSYVIDDDNPLVDSLNVGDNVVDIFSYTMSDNNPIDAQVSTSTLNITINGVNDAPIANADTADMMRNQSILIDALANDTDVDNNVSDFILTGVIIDAGLSDFGNAGSVTIENNQIRFSPDFAFENLAQGESATVVINYTMTDGNGGTSSSTATITVNGFDETVDYSGTLYLMSQTSSGGLQILQVDSLYDGVAELSLITTYPGTASAGLHGDMHPTDGKLYYQKGDGTGFGYYDVESDTHTIIGNLTLNGNSVNLSTSGAFDNNGNYYVGLTNTNSIYQVDLDTGALTLVGAVNGMLLAGGDFTITNTGDIYYVTSNANQAYQLIFDEGTGTYTATSLNIQGGYTGLTGLEELEDGGFVISSQNADALLHYDVNGNLLAKYDFYLDGERFDHGNGDLASYIHSSNFTIDMGDGATNLRMLSENIQYDIETDGDAIVANADEERDPLENTTDNGSDIDEFLSLNDLDFNKTELLADEAAANHYGNKIHEEEYNINTDKVELTYADVIEEEPLLNDASVPSADINSNDSPVESELPELANEAAFIVPNQYSDLSQDLDAQVLESF